jgi:hypothetical protein
LRFIFIVTNWGLHWLQPTARNSSFFNNFERGDKVPKSSNLISSDEELDIAIQEISVLVELGDNLSAEEYARVDELATMIEQYESVHFPMV